MGDIGSKIFCYGLKNLLMSLPNFNVLLLLVTHVLCGWDDVCLFITITILLP